MRSYLTEVNGLSLTVNIGVHVDRRLPFFTTLA